MVEIELSKKSHILIVIQMTFCLSDIHLTIVSGFWTLSWLFSCHLKHFFHRHLQSVTMYGDETTSST